MLFERSSERTNGSGYGDKWGKSEIVVRGTGNRLSKGRSVHLRARFHSGTSRVHHQRAKQKLRTDAPNYIQLLLEEEDRVREAW